MDKNFKPVYVRGTETGKGVIEALEALGGKNNFDYNGKNDTAIYYILPDGYIAAVSTNSTQGNYIMAVAKEVKPLRWRAELNNSYYIVNSALEVERLYEDGELTDVVLYNCGNYFRTEAEAKEMAEKIKKVLLP